MSHGKRRPRSETSGKHAAGDRMIRALLDFPWDLDELCNEYSDAYGVIERFARLCGAKRLDRVPFIDKADWNDLWVRISARRLGGNIYGALARFLEPCVQESFGGHRASPIPERPGIKDKWKRALRDEMGDCVDWRRPQIIASESRREAWFPGAVSPDVSIDCEGEPSGLHNRLIAFIGSYDEHVFTSSDFDPWDVRNGGPPPPAGRERRLPKPSCMEGQLLESLVASLPQAHQDGWCVNGKYCFVPPHDFDPRLVDSGTWRAGRAFRGSTAPNGRTGPIDSKGRIWSWHPAEGHWDVQLPSGDYIRISYLGDRLP